MTDPRLAVIVLAAGQGTRMKSARPKILHTLAGRSLIGHVLATARELAPVHVIAVVRHERDSIVAALAPVLTGESRPSWIGSPVLTIPAADGGTPRAALYPVCLSTSDVRCDVVAAGSAGSP